MKMKFTEEQLAEISTIQEQRSLTRKSAVQFYTRLHKKAAAAPAQPAKPKAAKPAPETGTPEKPAAPARVDSPTHQIILTPVAGYRAHTTVVHGKKAVVVFQERNRGKADARYNSVTVSDGKISDGVKAAKQSDLPLYIGLQVRVSGRWDSGWLIPAALFKQWRRGQDFNLGIEARAAYAADKESLAGGVRFEAAK